MTRGSGGRLLRAGSLIALVACCAALAGGCGGGSGHSSITLYNGQHAELTSSLVAAFEKETGITVQIRTNDSAVLADQIVQEGDASPADVYIAENSPELMELQRRGLLARLPQSILGQAPDGDNSPTGNWVGMALRVSSLVYNPARVPRSQLPASLLDLAQPQWKGKIAIAPTDSDFPPLVGAVIATHGEAAARDVARRPQAQRPDLPGRGGSRRCRQPRRRGDRRDQPYYWYRLRLELGKKAMHSALYYFSPGDVGAAVNISGAAVLKSSKHQKNAERFVSFLVSKAGQQIIAEATTSSTSSARTSRPTLRFRRSQASATPRSASPRSATASLPPA